MRSTARNGLRPVVTTHMVLMMSVTFLKVGVKHQGSKCSCGSTTHNHTSHRDCPLRNLDVNQDIVLKSEDSDTVLLWHRCL